MQKSPSNNNNKGIKALTSEAYICKLMESVSSKICHDLAGSVNALVNGVDLVEQEPESGEFFGVLKACANTASARVKFYRLAYGQAGQNDIASEEMIDAFEGVQENQRIVTDWYLDRMGMLTEGWGKLALLVLHFFMQSGARGSNISVRIETDKTQKFAELSLRGEGLLATEEFIDILKNDNLPEKSQITPHNCTACYLNLLVKSNNWNLKINKNEDSLVVRVKAS